MVYNLKPADRGIGFDVTHPRPSVWSHKTPILATTQKGAALIGLTSPPSLAGPWPPDRPLATEAWASPPFPIGRPKTFAAKQTTGESFINLRNHPRPSHHTPQFPVGHPTREYGGKPLARCVISIIFDIMSITRGYTSRKLSPSPKRVK